MTTTPNPTAEQAIAEALNDMWGGETHDGSPWSPEGSEVITIADKLRAHGLLSEGAPSEEQIERGAEGIWNEFWSPIHRWQTWQERIAAEVKNRGDKSWSGPVARCRAYARAALTAGVAPQAHVKPVATSLEPVKNSGESLHMLDPEKVADVLRLAMRAEAMMFGNGSEEWIAESDPVECLPTLSRALCEAYTEGKLT